MRLQLHTIQKYIQNAAVTIQNIIIFISLSILILSLNSEFFYFPFDYDVNIRVARDCNLNSDRCALRLMKN